LEQKIDNQGLFLAVCGTFLHLGNTPIPRANDDFDHFAITRFSHPPDSPDLAQCDFWLFDNLKTKLEGNICTSAMELMAKANEILMVIPSRSSKPRAKR
jgi:hypothetical protein